MRTVHRDNSFKSTVKSFRESWYWGLCLLVCLFAEPCKNWAYLCADWTESVEHSSHVGILKNMQNPRPYPEDLDSAGQG